MSTLLIIACVYWLVTSVVVVALLLTQPEPRSRRAWWVNPVAIFWAPLLLPLALIWRPR